MKNKMKKFIGILVIAVCCMPPSGAVAQKANSIQFRDLSFEEAMLAAQKEHKIIFVDVHNDRTFPMREEVEQDIFTKDSVIDYFNQHVIAIKMNMNGEEGKKFAPRLAMLMYPVYVFHDKNGAQLQFINSAGVLKTSGALLQKARQAVEEAHIKEINKRSIVFNDENWKQLLALAKKENKLIFLDAYTEWCRPCMQMARDVFTLDKVADFYNGKFINVSMDMEKGEGPAIAEKYKIKAYPTFLYINGEGRLVHRGGGYQEADQFIQLGKNALSDKKN